MNVTGTRRKEIVTGATALVVLLALALLDPMMNGWHRTGQRKGSASIVHKEYAEIPEAVISRPLTPAQKWLNGHYPSFGDKKHLQHLYESLIAGYEVPQTGLFLSFPRTPDLRLVQQAATYDQGIVGILLLKVGDTKRAGKIVEFYEKAWADAATRSGPRANVYGLANFYNAFHFVEGVEKTMHVGPNAWIGLLASRYSRRTNDPQALALALDIAHWIIEKVPHKNGAVAMGQIPWNSALWPKIFSTENNLSTYAFLTDLSKSDQLVSADRKMINDERQGIAHWLVSEGYRPDTGKVLRGFHWHGLDTAGAIDSYTWFISSLRPSFVAKNKISPESLIARAGSDFGVTVKGHRGIDCVDQGMADATYQDAVEQQYRDPGFLRPANDHHRLVWYEGQGQYIMALEDMGVYAAEESFKSDGTVAHADQLKQADAWLQEAKLYTDEFDKAAFEMPHGTGFPLATPGRFYLHGWPAPMPMKDHPADAVAPLVWRLFVGMGYEPLSDTQLSPTVFRAKRSALITYRDPGTTILYGASEEMSVYAWRLYEQHDLVNAKSQADATIALWEDDAKALEVMKEKTVGTYYTFDGTVDQFQRIHNYWALNDVAACYFILAKIADEKQDYTTAYNDLLKILTDFHLAQMWDKRGWFWDPIDTIKEDYAESFPDHYGGLMAKIPDIQAVPSDIDTKTAPEDQEPYFAKIAPTQPVTAVPVFMPTLPAQH